MLLSGFHPDPFTFGQQELSDRMFREQRIIAILVILPLSTVVGQLSLRVASRPPLSMLRADIWNALIRLLLADCCIELLQKSMSCVPFEDYDNARELLQESLGYSCPLYARALDPRATAVVFGMRLLAMAVGVYLGEGWMPVAITGGVATGKSTVSTLLVEGRDDSQESNEDANADDNDNTGDNNTANDEKDTVLEPSQEAAEGGGAVYFVDTDKIGHAIVLESTAGNVHSKLVATFGEEILDEEGVIDRKKLGAIVFQDESLRRTLNKIMHPRIIIKIDRKSVV